VIALLRVYSILPKLVVRPVHDVVRPDIYSFGSIPLSLTKECSQGNDFRFAPLQKGERQKAEAARAKLLLFAFCFSVSLFVA
jgi:hypothetical protein